jgi:hypothetical protein
MDARAPKLPTITGNVDYEPWKKAIDVLLFSKKSDGVTLESMSRKNLLDVTYFTKQEEFKQDLQRLSNNPELDDPFDDENFTKKCYDHASETTRGYKNWVYSMYLLIYNSLSTEIKDKVAGAQTGDLLDLVASINLAIRHFEVFDPTTLEIAFCKMTMEEDGGNDVMQFLTRLKAVRTRLRVAKHPVSDEKAMTVLVKGLNKDVFSQFIYFTQRIPYKSYDELVDAVKKEASHEDMMVKLDALHPGQTASTMVTTTESPEKEMEKRLTRLEHILVNMNSSSKKPPNARKSNKPCWGFSKQGTCRKGDACNFSHDTVTSNASNPQNSKKGKYCFLHEVTTHDTQECNAVKRDPKLQEAYAEDIRRQKEAINSMEHVNAQDDATFDYFNCVHHMFVMPKPTKGRVDKWCCDGGSTAFATYDRTRCTNIKSCKVLIAGPDAEHKSFTCHEKGETDIVVTGPQGEAVKLHIVDVLISAHFPFHIFSEIEALRQGATCYKEQGKWTFYNNEQDTICTASQQLKASRNLALYFIDQHPGLVMGEPKMKTVRFKDDNGSRDLYQHHQAHQAVLRTTRTVLQNSTPSSSDISASNNDTIQGPTHISKASKTVATQKELLPRISTRKNNASLLELHLTLGHRNFRALAKQFHLTLPDPVPQCWACLMSKPVAITPDKVSTKQATRPYEGLCADAKGPMTVSTPEGFRYFFVIICLFSKVHWVVLAKSQEEWVRIWPAFVRSVEARLGSERVVSYVVTDMHKVHSQKLILEFNNQRGTCTMTSAPYSQWQDPAESGIKVISTGARTSLIQGGGKSNMWGHAVLHQADATNLTPPAKQPLGHEGKCRWQILFPSENIDKLLRRSFPFLCLFMKTVAHPLRRADFNPRAIPCLHLRWDPTKKSFLLMTLPSMKITWGVEGVHVPGVFPLRAIGTMDNALYRPLRQPGNAQDFDSLTGPAGLMRKPQDGPTDSQPLLQGTPVEARTPVIPSETPGPGYSRKRGYMPSIEGLQSAANIHVARPSQLFTSDELQQRAPKSTAQALRGPDKDKWRVSILKHHDMLRELGTFVDITETKPEGPTPPGCENKFSFKFSSDHPIALEDIPPEWWYTRTITRGDHFSKPVHYDKVSAPNVAAPTIKIYCAWVVALGLFLYWWDETSAFNKNKPDIKGTYVGLPPGYDPYSKSLRPLDAPKLYGILARTLPGMPQGSRIHYFGMVDDLRKLGFDPTAPDPGLFVHRNRNEAMVLHVDDGLLACESDERAMQILGPQGLGKRRKLKFGRLDESGTYLSLQFKVSYTADERLIFVSQERYAATVLERAGMTQANPVLTPAVPGRRYSKYDGPKDEAERERLASKGLTKEKYMTLVMSTAYLVIQTRPDMLFIQGKLAKFCADPGQEHFNALNHMMRYLKGTLKYGVEFRWRKSDPKPTDGPIRLEAYSDSSYGDDPDTGKTTLGFLVKANGATVSASSKLSKRVDSCVNHSELHAFGNAVGVEGDLDHSDMTTDGACDVFARTTRDVKWIIGVKSVLERRTMGSINPIPHYVDNAGVISIIDDATMKSPNKHIFRTVCECREAVHKDKVVVPVKIPTKENLSNGLTKQEHGLKESAAQLRELAGPTTLASSGQGGVLNHK